MALRFVQITALPRPWGVSWGECLLGSQFRSGHVTSVVGLDLAEPWCPHPRGPGGGAAAGWPVNALTVTLAGPVGSWSPRLHLCVFCVPGSLALGDGSTDRGPALEEFQGFSGSCPGSASPPHAPCPGDVQRGWDRLGSRLTGSSCPFSLFPACS